MNYIYWQGRAVGIDMGHFISWFPSAPREAIEAWRKSDAQPKGEV